MAIYDYDYTAMHEISKLYDYDYTTMHEISKGYDNDGTTHHEIFTSSDYRFENGVFTPDFGTVSFSAWNNAQTHYSVDYLGMHYTRYYEPATYGATQLANNKIIELSGQRTMTVVWEGTTPYSGAGIYGTCVFGLSTTRTPSTKNSDTFGSSFAEGCAIAGGYTWRASGGGTTTLDISNLRGNYYFVWGIMNYQGKSTANISKIIIE